MFGSKCADCGKKNGEHSKTCAALSIGSQGYRDGKPRRGDTGYAKAKQKSDDLYKKEQDRRVRRFVGRKFSTEPKLQDLPVGYKSVKRRDGGYEVVPASDSRSGTVRKELGGYHS